MSITYQPWRSAVEFKRYLLRFIHMVSGFNELHGTVRTVYNQNDSMVRDFDDLRDDRGDRTRCGRTHSNATPA